MQTALGERLPKHSTGGSQMGGARPYPGAPPPSSTYNGQGRPVWKSRTSGYQQVPQPRSHGPSSSPFGSTEMRPPPLAARSTSGRSAQEDPKARYSASGTVPAFATGATVPGPGLPLDVQVKSAAGGGPPCEKPLRCSYLAPAPSAPSLSPRRVSAILSQHQLPQPTPPPTPAAKTNVQQGALLRQLTSPSSVKGACEAAAAVEANVQQRALLRQLTSPSSVKGACEAAAAVAQPVSKPASGADEPKKAMVLGYRQSFAQDDPPTVASAVYRPPGGLMNFFASDDKLLQEEAARFTAQTHTGNGKQSGSGTAVASLTAANLKAQALAPADGLSTKKQCSVVAAPPQVFEFPRRASVVTPNIDPAALGDLPTWSVPLSEVWEDDTISEEQIKAAEKLANKLAAKRAAKR